MAAVLVAGGATLSLAQGGGDQGQPRSGGEDRPPGKPAKPYTGPCAQFVPATAEHRDCTDKVKNDSDRRRLGECAQHSAGSVDRQRCLQARKDAAKLPCDQFKAGTLERSQCLDRLAAEEQRRQLGDCSQFAAGSSDRQACLAKQPAIR